MRRYHFAPSAPSPTGICSPKPLSGGCLPGLLPAATETEPVALVSGQAHRDWISCRLVAS